MRHIVKLSVTASALALAVPSGAATYVFNGGNYIPGTTAPEPLMAPDILDLNTVSSKTFAGVTMTNQSGTVNWNGGAIFLGGGATINNQSTWNAFGNDTLTLTTGGGTFLNSGLFSKGGGAGITAVSANFTNSGIIEALIGSINFTSGVLNFNAGSVFQGAGAINVNANAAFNGAFTSSNLNLATGTMTGTGAVLNGSADWNSGSLAGGWTVASGSELNALSTSSKIFSGTNFANNGTVNWADGALFLGGNALVTNNGQWNIQENDAIAPTTGGGTFVNNGDLTKTGGAGASLSSVNFTNNGTIDAQSGSINFTGGTLNFNAGSDFTGAGAVNVNSNATFTGAFTSSNLNLNNGTMTGAGAVLNGSADWNSGSLAGGWTVAAGSELNALSASSKIFSGTNFTNNGTFNWADGTLFLGGGAVVGNAGTMNITGNGIITTTTGGGTFTNSGLIEKTAGVGTTTISNTVGFDNNGTMNVLSGTIALPTNFVNDGTMAGTANYTVGGVTGLTNNGTIAPGDIGATGTLGLTGNFKQSATGTLATQFASSISSDLFNVSGTAALDGTLALSCIMSCAINTGDIFVILNSNGALSGMFSTVTTSGFLNGFDYEVIYDYTNSEVRVAILNAGMNGGGAVPEPATWAMLILGFGLVGGAMRRRQRGAMRLA